MPASLFSALLVAGATSMTPPAVPPVSIQGDDFGPLDGICTRNGVLEIHEGRELLWDNSLSCVGGKSHLSGLGRRRSVLDDFKVPAPGWTMDTVHLKFAWADGTTGTGTDFEVVIFGDAGGRPDFDNLVAIAQNRVYHEVRDPYDPEFFGLTIVDIGVTFDPITLGPGRYWADLHVVGPVNGFHVNGMYPQGELESIWVDYEDFGGRQPGRNVFGDDYDQTLWIFGERDCAPDGCAVWPDQVVIEHGSIRGGSIEDLRESDDAYLLIEPRPSVTPLTPVIRVEFRTITSFETFPRSESASRLRFSLESAANSIPARPLQRIALANLDPGPYEVLDERITTFDDSTTLVEVTEDAGRFLELRTTEARTRVEYFNPGNVIRPSWTVRFDQVRWEITPCQVQIAVPFADDFEIDRGWSVVNENVVEGGWVRTDPVGGFLAPSFDYDGSGKCYLTDDDRFGNLNGGPTRLVSPTLDMSAPGTQVLSYARWAASNGEEDVLEVEISNDDGGSWVLLERIPASADPDWVFVEIEVADYIEPTATMRVRFSMADTEPESRVEGAVDAVTVEVITCP